MSDRIQQIAQAYAANASEVDKLAAAIADLVRDERELLRKIVDAWVRVGKCEDEFLPDSPNAQQVGECMATCGEHHAALDDAIYRALYVIYPERKP